MVALRRVPWRQRRSDRIALAIGESDQPGSPFRVCQGRDPRQTVAGGGQPAAVAQVPAVLDARPIEPLRLANVALDGRNVAEEHEGAGHASAVTELAKDIQRLVVLGPRVAGVTALQAEGRRPAQCQRDAHQVVVGPRGGGRLVGELAGIVGRPLASGDIGQVEKPEGNPPPIARAAQDGAGLLVQLPRPGEIAPLDAEVGQVAARIRDAIGISELPVGVESSRMGGEGGREVALLGGQAAEPGQRVGAQLRDLPVGPGQGPRQPAPGLDQVPADLPIAPQVAGQAELGGGSGRVIVRVSDRGRGIPPSKQADVFEPFFRSREAGEGSGLGLAICRGLVEANGGRIELQSTVGRGTSFAVSFPLVGQPVEAR